MLFLSIKQREIFPVSNKKKKSIYNNGRTTVQIRVLHSLWQWVPDPCCGLFSGTSFYSDISSTSQQEILIQMCWNLLKRQSSVKGGAFTLKCLGRLINLSWDKWNSGAQSDLIASLLLLFITSILTYAAFKSESELVKLSWYCAQKSKVITDHINVP